MIERRTIHVPDIEADPEYRLTQSFNLGGWRSIIGGALMREGVVIGTLALARAANGPFSARQIELTETSPIRPSSPSRIAAVRGGPGQDTPTRVSLEDLKATQTRLIQSEKLASLGQLTAGIAHEIKNPLNFVNKLRGPFRRPRR